MGVEFTDITVSNRPFWHLFLVARAFSIMEELAYGAGADASPADASSFVSSSEFPRPRVIPILTTSVSNAVLMTFKWIFTLCVKRNCKLK